MVFEMGFRARNVSGTFEKRDPGPVNNVFVYPSENEVFVKGLSPENCPKEIDDLKTNVSRRSNASRTHRKSQ